MATLQKIGIPFTIQAGANTAVTSSTTLVATDLVLPIAVAETARARVVAAVTLAGAASGAKFQVVTPAAPTTYQVEFQIYNGSTNALATAGVITASAAFSNALANAATHFAIIDIFVVNGTTAGNITVQFAQLVSDAAAATFLAGATMTGNYL